MYGNGHYNLQFACMFIVYLVWFGLLIPVRRAQAKAEGGIDNSNPRAQYNNLPGYAIRSMAAHNNTMESFMFFGFALLANTVGGGSLVAADVLCVIFMVCRIAYAVAYVMDYPSIRSSIWFISFLSTFILFIIPFGTYQY
ncbi:hypothetical protein CONCODRAFT_73106 [Conidiobolus coronatus NRRL 28638]|uniref:MAPEG family protein n=1 Tax=Conidiobolus coronatus (strain ATCC 28846 / CBS 209.66 / NRRL 28638) TaxID=796925 RepID=A0A137NX17_CONC2|nr:hypothetical protein CONCODRAFT_73106 [Conidiobolus coronatus NRRL 28638]|eukprot:KXN67267.1 hypothetical protein CONCODRAFT_73106 [Conidiobolus coronatus NRRL 28638]